MPELIAPNTSLLHYRIISPLGAGGMGEVYLAEDTKLGRQVALKLLPHKFTQDADRVRRFEREARTASALNHPNILTIYEIGCVDHTHFIATEFVAGQTLRQHLMHEKMQMSAVLEVMQQVASALTAAHEAGIVHRDIKPENLMLRPDGFVKVLDFGLAKLTERFAQMPMQMVDTEAPTGLAGETDPGTVLGTVHYMSPEQARGLKVDARSDIFSLGIVLYEMIAGRRPFIGATASDVIAAILQTEPLPLSQFVPQVPAELDRIVTQALRKDCAARYQATKELQLDLKHLQQELEFAARQQQPLQPSLSDARTMMDTALPVRSERTKESTGEAASSVRSASSSRKRRSRIDSLAILPLASASLDSQAEYLSDGITENVINRLSPLPKLKVMARSTVFRFKGQEVNPQAVGQLLSVRAVLTGRVLQLGDRIVIKTELVDVADGTQIWGGQFNRQLTDLFALEEDISREISEQLQLKLGAQPKRSAKKRIHPEAYELCLKGNYYFHKASPDAVKKAIECFQQAIAADPSYAQAYAGLARAYMWASYTFLSPREALPQAEQAALTALRLNEKLAEAHTSLGQVKMLKDWDWAGAEAEIKCALALNPKAVDALHQYSLSLTLQGRFDEAIAMMMRALETDPLSLFTNAYLGMILLLAHQTEKAMAQCQKTLELDPHCPPALGFLGMAYEEQGNYTAAIEVLERQRQLTDIPLVLSNLGYAYGLAGRVSEAQQLLDELQARAEQRPVPPEYIAIIYAGLGQLDHAFAWLERGYEEHSVVMPIWLKTDPRLDRLRKDTRGAELLRRVGLAT